MANNIHDAFDNIRADDRLKESTKQFLSQRRMGNIPSSHSLRLRKMLVTVCILLVFAAGLGYSWMRMPVSYVSIDINPSIELALNRLDRVASVTAFNAEGEALVAGLSLKGKKYTNAINLLVESSAMKSYLTEEAEIVFTVAAPGIRNEELQSGIEHCHSHNGHNCYSVSADIGLVSAAHEYGLSFGKYNAYLQLAAYDETITVDDCRDMSMSEIHQCIRAHGKHGESEPHEQKNQFDNEKYEDSDTEKSEDEGSDSGNSDNDADSEEPDESEAESHHGGHGHHGGGHE